MYIKFDHKKLQQGFEVETIRKGGINDAIETVLHYKSSSIKDPKNVWYTDSNGYFI